MKKIEPRPVLRWVVTLLRMAIGWQFLYEGIVKLFNPDWTAAAFLAGSHWLFAPFFHWMAANSVAMQIVDLLNVWGLILVGLALFSGLFVRLAAISGVVLLGFYYAAYPPIPGQTFGMLAEGSYLWVNKNLIELIMLAVIAYLPRKFSYGLDRLFLSVKEMQIRKPVPEADRQASPGEEKEYGRREILKDLISLPVIGAFSYALFRKRQWDSFEEKYLIDSSSDGTSGATLKSFNFSRLEELKGELPKGKIGNLSLSRLIMGGNLIGGWAHSRDLIYVSKLVKAYHTDEKVMETMQMAERCGVNAIITNPQLNRIINKYWHETQGSMQFISDCGYQMDFIEGIKLSIDGGAHACYCQGEITDRLVPRGEFETLAKGIELIRQNGLPAGIGAHRIETIKACVEAGIRPDFWVKTLHQHNYWSAAPDKEWNDNMFCFRPEDTIRYMESLEEPWIAFKVLAAGALRPEEGFQYAFDNGADFICVGMYDFQLVDDVNITLDTLKRTNRNRPWRG